MENRTIGTFEELGLSGSFLHGDYEGAIKDAGLSTDVDKVVGYAPCILPEDINHRGISVNGLVEAAMALDLSFIMIDFSAFFSEETTATPDDIIALKAQLDAIPELIKGTRYKDLASYEFRTSIVEL